MKRLNLRRTLLLAVISVSALGAAAQSGAHPQPAGDAIGPLAHIQAPAPNYHFPDNQTYVYGADWRIWSAGTATLRLERNGDEQHVSAGADSAGFVALLYRVHDRFDAWFDPRTFCSQRLVKHTEEGLRRRDTNIHYDYTRHKSVLDETNLKNNQKKHAEEDIPGCVTDVLSGMYYLGSLPLQLGNSYVFPLNDGGKTVEVRATAEVKEQVKTDAGTFSTVRVQVESSIGLMKDRGKVWLWYTDDAQRILVQMRARLFWGSLTLKLQRVEKQ